jgi:peptide methionine sulfoxide reductase msrA/msrB
MKNGILVTAAIFSVVLFFTLFAKEEKMKQYNKLTSFEQFVILEKGTEPPFKGEYTDTKVAGTYICRQCDTPLFRSEDKFSTTCGWPSFDDELPRSVKKVIDKDGVRTEIVCANCGGHLGHIFVGEKLTPKNSRYCVNSVSLKLIADNPRKIKKAYFGGGCFWGVEHLLQDVNGVISVVSGYAAGETINPTYKEVCSGKTGHAEVVEVTYDSVLISYENLAKQFFEIHNPTQKNFQGPDRGTQYRSIVIVENVEEREIVNSLIDLLKSKGLDVVTEVVDKTEFYKAEEYHQDYYEKKGGSPYCHFKVERF